MDYKPDILITDNNKNPLLAIEVKEKEVVYNYITILWAYYRNDLIEMNVPYFMILTTNKGYLWNVFSGNEDPIEFPFKHNYEKLTEDSPFPKDYTFSHSSMVSLIRTWITSKIFTHSKTDKELDELYKIGLFDKLKKSDILQEQEL